MKAKVHISRQQNGTTSLAALIGTLKKHLKSGEYVTNILLEKAYDNKPSP
ncbi:hypothetical protein [Aquirufa ecclesiirivi]|nr:hypothetical protein [Aquirufa ecclesiirivi]MDF0693239.1 hypothetical protein [Aquirufa ecclesiirivi]